MKKILFATAFIACLASCSQPDPVQDAVAARVAEIVGGVAKVNINTFELIDSVTFGQQLDMADKLYEVRHKQNEKLYFKYMSQSLFNEALEKRASLVKDEYVIAGLRAIRERMSDSLDVVAYYDYKFSGNAKNGEGETVFPEAYASVTPDIKVISLEPERSRLHNGLGKVIPGYLELLEADKNELDAAVQAKARCK